MTKSHAFAGFYFMCRFITVTGIRFRITNVSAIKTDYTQLVSSESLTKCAGLCAIDYRCNRLMYERQIQLCRLLSNFYNDRTDIFTLPKPSGWELYYPVHKDCLVAGYFFDRNTNTCIKLYTSPILNWADSRNICQSDGGDLITIQTLPMLNYVFSYIDDIADDKFKTWIGLTTDTWINGAKFDRNSLSVTDNDSYFVNTTDKNCGRLRFDPNFKLIRSIWCLYELTFFCEILITS